MKHLVPVPLIVHGCSGQFLNWTARRGYDFQHLIGHRPIVGRRFGDTPPRCWHNGIVHGGVDYYHLLGVRAGCSIEELRAGYRAQARSLHPDVCRAPDAAQRMGEVNQAWRVLSDPKRRAEYDRSVGRKRPPPPPQPPPATPNQRRQAWGASIAVQVTRLARQAGRSATQAQLLRSPRSTREHYDRVVEAVVRTIASEPEARARAARAAGIAPLDLGVGATLVGIRAAADVVRRDASLGITTELMMTAELLDRMWDVVAHELPPGVATAIGGNPHVARALGSR